MAGGNLNYSAVLADLESRKAELESAIAAIKAILAAGGGGGGSVGAGGVHDPDNIPVGSFLRLTIVEATKKLLDMTKVKLNLSQIAKALERGGLPPAKQNTIYAVLRRRESDVGDLIRFGDEWALSEWYPNNPNLKKKAGSSKSTAKKKTAKKPTAKSKSKVEKKQPAKVVKQPEGEKEPKTAPVSQADSTIKTPDAVEKILMDAGSSLDLKTLVERVNTTLGKGLTVGLLKGMLNREPKRFKYNGDDNTWSLGTKSETNSAASGG